MRSFAPMPTVGTSIAFDELRCYAVIDFDDGESATHAGIDAEDSHGMPLLEFWLVRLRDCFGELACVLDVFFGARLYFPLAIFRGAYAEGHRMDGKDSGKQERVFRRMFRRIELSQHTLDHANFFGVADKRACDCGQRRGDMVEKILHGNDTQFGGVRLMGGVTRTPPVKDISRSESFDEDVPDGLGADLAYSLDLLRLGHGIPQQHDERLGAEQLLHAVRGEFLFCGLERQRGLLFALDIFAVVNDVMHGLAASSRLSFRSGKPFNGGHRLRGARRRFGVMPVSSDRTAVRTDRAGRASCGRC